MPMFDYKGEDARELVAVARELSLFYSKDEVTLEDGWRKLTAAELGVGAERVDSAGQFRGEGLVEAQALVLGRFVDGALVRLSVAFTATNGADAPDYSAMEDDSYANAFDYLLDATREYAQGRGLTGADVIVTGYSLGAGAANTVAAQRDTSWEGFYADSDYLGFAAPKITELPDVLNFGFENDVVHRVQGQGDKDARADDPTLGVLHNDGPFATATDNLVLFNDTYANPLFPVVPFVLANLPEGWSAHVDFSEFDIIGRIGGSNFYDLIEADSTVVVAYLNDQLRAVTWVEDKAVSTSDHFGTMGFILGGETADRLGDGSAADFLDGFGGDDRFRLSTGDDHVHGGAGTDTVQLSGAIADYEVMRLGDGTLVLRDRTDVNGVEFLQSVERVTTGGLGASVYQVTARGLDISGSGFTDIRYAAVTEGSAGADVLATSGRGGRLFGLDGDDQLFGQKFGDLLAGGAGRDRLDGREGANTLLGGAGDDYLVANGGDDRLSGGVGSDTFDFRRGLGGEDVITDFDLGEQGDDSLKLSRADFKSFADVVAHGREVGGDLVIEGPNGTLTLVGLGIEDLTPRDVFLI